MNNHREWSRLARELEKVPSRPAPAIEKHTPATSRGLEFKTQSSFIDWVRIMERQQIPELVNLYAIPNGGHRHPAGGGKMKREGVRRGVPDLHLAVARGGYHSLYLETKAPGGSLSKWQVEMIRSLREAGNRVEICFSVDELITKTMKYLNRGYQHEQGNIPPDR